MGVFGEKGFCFFWVLFCGESNDKLEVNLFFGRKLSLKLDEVIVV